MINDYFVLEEMEYATDTLVDATWTALSNDTTLLAASTIHATGKYGVKFDKEDKSDGNLEAAIYRTVTFDDTVFRNWRANDYIAWEVFVEAVTDVAYTFVRLGTDASNYNEWRTADSGLTALRFTMASARLGECYVAGNGWNPSNVDYMCVGVMFDAEDDELKTDGIVLDRVFLISAWSI